MPFSKIITVIYLLLSLLFISCGSSNKLIKGGEVEGEASANNIINNHYNNTLDFKTIRGKVKVDYDDGDNSQSVTLSLRMEKDKAIWLSAPLAVVKVYLTPERASFYNTLDGTYFDGDFGFISELLGAELNFYNLQNLLIGEAVFNLKDAKYSANISKNAYQLKPVKDNGLYKMLFLLEPLHYKMALQQLSQPEKSRLLNVEYKTYQSVSGLPFPDELLITAEEGTAKTTIKAAFKNIEFNQKLNFPYQIPGGYKQVTIK